MRANLVALWAVVIILLSLRGNALADAIYWNGAAGDGNWSFNGNWNGGVKPGDGDLAVIGGPPGTNIAFATNSASESVYAVRFAEADNTTGTLTIASGAALSVVGVTNTILGGAKASVCVAYGKQSRGTLLINGGALTLTSNMVITLRNAYGSVIQDGGTVIVTGRMYMIAESLVSNDPGYAEYILKNGAILNVSNIFTIMTSAHGTSVVVQAPGTTVLCGDIFQDNNSGTIFYTMTGATLRVLGSTILAQSSTCTNIITTVDSLCQFYAGVNTFGGSGMCIFTQKGGTNYLEGSMRFGGAASANSTFHLRQGGLVDLTNGNLVIAYSGTGRFIQDPGTTLRATPSTMGIIMGDTLNGVGYYTMSGGVVNVGQIEVGGNGYGEFTQCGGTNLCSDYLRVGTASGGTGIYTITAGEITITNDLEIGFGIGSAGYMDIGAVTVRCSAAASTFHIGSRNMVAVNGSTGTVFLRGGYVEAANARLKRYEFDMGTLRGWGTIKIGAEFMMNGRVIADGFGSDHTLVITNYTKFSNKWSNATTGTNGWFAVDKGRLCLNPLTVSADCATNWGEGLNAFDLVNAVKFNLSGVTGNGSLCGSLVDTNYSGVPAMAPTSKVCGVWYFQTNGFAFGNSTLSFRYDHTRTGEHNLAEAAVKPYWSASSNDSWLILSNYAVDTASNVMLVSNVTRAGWFAIGLIGPPTSPQGTFFMFQ